MLQEHQQKISYFTIDCFNLSFTADQASKILRANATVRSFLDVKGNRSHVCNEYIKHTQQESYQQLPLFVPLTRSVH